MIPERFISEYPRRCLQILKIAEETAQKENLLSSFSLLMASSLLVIPFERMRLDHPLQEIQLNSTLIKNFRILRDQKFCHADFWEGNQCGEWRFAELKYPVNSTDRWRDQHGRHPFASLARIQFMGKNVSDILRCIRNALAHGNIVYLDGEGRERPGREVTYLAFLSRVQDRDPSPYNMVAAREVDFLRFLYGWARWLDQFPESELREAA